jgi:DNA-binding NarL/FixJ family response regulator
VKPIRILIADDHKLFRQSLRQVCESEGYEVIGEAVDGEATAELARQLHPDVILMDITLPVMDSVTTISRIRQENPEIRMIVMAPYQDPTAAMAALKAGARGFLLKDDSAEAILEAVKAVYRNEAPVDPYLTARLLDELGRLSGATDVNASTVCAYS